MSADLFAEFSNPSQPTKPAPQPSLDAHSSRPQSHQFQGWTQDPADFGENSDRSAPGSRQTHPWPSAQAQTSGVSSWTSLAQPSQVTQQASLDDEDGWGDFEVAESEAPTTRNVPQLPASKAQEPRPVQRPVQRVTRVPTIDLMTNTLVDVGRPVPSNASPSWSQHQTISKPKSQMRATPSDPNVLFDADDFELQDGRDDEDDDDDEFGDFEAVAPPPSRTTAAFTSTASVPPSLDLLGLDDPPLPPPSEKVERQPPPGQTSGTLSFGASSSVRAPAPKATTFQDRNPFPDLSVTTSAGSDSRRKGQVDSPATAWPSNAKELGVAKAGDEDEDEDDWAAWDDIPAAHSSAKKAGTSDGQPNSWDWDAAGGGQPPAEEASDNGPPPTNVPPPSVILATFPELFHSGNSLFKPAAGQTASIKQQVFSDRKALQFLEGYILLGTTAARVIAGRKHRWHRDKILAKSMSISAAGSKGMKLAGVDKTQSAREDREAADVVAAWREHVGRLRSAVATANSSGRLNLKVPELSESMQVQTAKMAPAAPKPCIICGLKRNERVAKVDFDVEDTFGEWWVEHWGHRACRNFWVEHEQQLRQR